MLTRGGDGGGRERGEGGGRGGRNYFQSISLSADAPKKIYQLHYFHIFSLQDFHFWRFQVWKELTIPVVNYKVFKFVQMHCSCAFSSKIIDHL